MSIRAVAACIKKRFPNLTVDETIAIAEECLEAASTPLSEANKAFVAAIEQSRCGHGRLHIFCGQCAGTAK